MQALSIPTWIIHISSVVEWAAAIWLVWTYAEVSRNLAWRSLSVAMLPALGSAMCACTWHFFDNPPALEWLVTLQAALTFVGNITLCGAGWWIWRSARPEASEPSTPALPLKAPQPPASANFGQTPSPTATSTSESNHSSSLE